MYIPNEQTDFLLSSIVCGVYEDTQADSRELAQRENRGSLVGGGGGEVKLVGLEQKAGYSTL